MAENKIDREYLEKLGFTEDDRKYVYKRSLKIRSLYRFAILDSGVTNSGEIKHEKKLVQTIYRVIPLMFGLSLLIPKGKGKWKIRSEVTDKYKK